MKNRTYTVQAVSNLRTGDFIKISRRTVESVANKPGQTVVTFVGGGTGVFYGWERFGIYR